ncbi:SRPBCC family protein [Parasedimentitalea maritima]|uniref:SRPBCC family protein n=1 Tax=Parasedimentitalea maritima TaxID=2578117 RepID=A0A5R8ZRR1_9RHOB|nr:SRPBCC family protein [Zongyanglinia marina]KAE9632559.1 SRPBCC family protein [Zongyanglinia marina]TLP69065.1 SRPBCC family protein [Zongyanglinia marina]
MKFVSKEDIEAPIAEVFAVLSEFENFERSAIRRGVEVQRMGDVAAPASGLGWDVQFMYRGKSRDLHLKLAEYEPVTGMRLSAEGGGIEGGLDVELLALSPRRTRMVVVLELKPRTLSGRLLVQSLKLAKSKLTKRYKLRVAEFAKLTEERLSRTA